MWNRDRSRALEGQTVLSNLWRSTASDILDNWNLDLVVLLQVMPSVPDGLKVTIVA